MNIRNSSAAILSEGRFILTGGQNVISNSGAGSINDNSGYQASLNINQPVTRPPIQVYTHTRYTNTTPWPSSTQSTTTSTTQAEYTTLTPDTTAA